MRVKVEVDKHRSPEMDFRDTNLVITVLLFFGNGFQQ